MFKILSLEIQIKLQNHFSNCKLWPTPKGVKHPFPCPFYLFALIMVICDPRINPVALFLEMWHILSVWSENLNKELTTVSYQSLPPERDHKNEINEQKLKKNWKIIISCSVLSWQKINLLSQVAIFFRNTKCSLLVITLLKNNNLLKKNQTTGVILSNTGRHRPHERRALVTGRSDLFLHFLCRQKGCSVLTKYKSLLWTVQTWNCNLD